MLPATPLLAQGSQPDALAALRAAVDSEMLASRTDRSNWMYRDEDDTPEHKAIYNTVETPQGSLRRLIQLDGHPLGPGAVLDELTRIQAYVHDSAAQNHARRNGQHDDAQAAELLRMLPDAFLWNISSQNAETITLDFRPNPAFDPPDTQSRVLGAMAGQLVIARNGNRIRSLRGRLTREIVFGLAMFGKLDAGGSLRRRAPGRRRWPLADYRDPRSHRRSRAVLQDHRNPGRRGQDGLEALHGRHARRRSSHTWRRIDTLHHNLPFRISAAPRTI